MLAQCRSVTRCLMRPDCPMTCEGAEPMADVDNNQDVIDSRQIIARIEELENDIELAEIPDNEIGGPNDTMTEERAELATLQALSEEAAGYASDWNHGETLIRGTYFTEYAQQLADDIGAIPDGVRWPLTCIDWDKAAEELQQDYTALDWDGVEYWVRAY